jgi:hypothetical protein
LDGREQPNESLPRSEVFYTLNVLLGLSRLSQVPRDIDVSTIFERNVMHLLRLPVEKYAFGMTLWSAAELGLRIPREVMRHIEALLSTRENWRTFRAQDLGMMLSGIVALAKADRTELCRFAEPLFEFIVERYRGPCGVFFDAPFGFRRRFASFASQTYLSLACYSYGELTRNAHAIELANACTRRLIDLQGPHGEWPWFFDAQNGVVVDFYEVYSVHQYGMAPAFLECAERHGISKAKDAIIRGFNWVLGDNQRGNLMLMPELCLSIRSQVRKHELYSTKRRAARAVRNALLWNASTPIGPESLQLRLECRSYELGWLLWSFGNRTDLPQLTHNQIFVDALSQSGKRNIPGMSSTPRCGGSTQRLCLSSTD